MMFLKETVLIVALLSVSVSFADGSSTPQSTSTTSTIKPSTSSIATTTPTTTPQPIESTTTSAGNCSQYNSDCDQCVSQLKATCVYCKEEKACKPAISRGLFDIGKVCKGGLLSTSWATCSVNMMALIIAGGTIGGVILISLVVCICCCCCCKNSAKAKLKWMREDAANQRKADERKAKYAERRAERQAKNDEIRKKYGLFKDGQGGYQRFEDDDA